MKHYGTFKVVPDRGGFISTIVAPCQQRRESRFTPVDFTMLLLLVAGALLGARVIMGH